jgi:hypothetical protein
MSRFVLSDNLHEYIFKVPDFCRIPCQILTDLYEKSYLLLEFWLNLTPFKVYEKFIEKYNACKFQRFLSVWTEGIVLIMAR